jgi:hypothetical protein
LLENKGVEFCVSAKKRKKVQKSAQEFEKAEVRYCGLEVGGENRDEAPLHPRAFVRMSNERGSGRGHL